MIIYIHGFGSHGLGGKASAFRAYFEGKEEEFIAPSLSYVPQLAMQTLEEHIAVCSDVKNLSALPLAGIMRSIWQRNTV